MAAAGDGPTRIALDHGRGTTPIVIGRGVLREPLEELATAVGGRTLFVVTTPRVRQLHGGLLDPALAAARRRVTLEVEEGEAAKRLAVAERLWREMAAAGGKRDSRVAAFGGGSVGDLAGFAAGAFLRGVPFVQLPTTLLAQVDAAIGGKTAVDLPEAKNSVGLFHHPELVVCDVELLATLPPGELRSGLVEVIKIAALEDLDLLERVESTLERLVAGDPAALQPVVAAAVRAKVAVVEEDADDHGRRRILNFGHTLGHAIEAGLGYQGLRHGEAVGYGMLFALRLARRRGLVAEGAERVRGLLKALPLPGLPPCEPERLLILLRRDKKAREEGLAWVLPRALGEGAAAETVEEEELRAELAEFLADPLAETT